MNKILSKMRFIYGILVCWFVILEVRADYDCLCNYNVELPVYPSTSDLVEPTGYLYEFDCKPTATQVKTESDVWVAIQYEKKIAYVLKDQQTQVQICSGVIPVLDKVPNTQAATTRITTTTPTTTTKPTTTTTHTTSTTTSPTTTTTTPTTPQTTTPTTTTLTTTTSATTTTTPSTTMTTTATTTTPTTPTTTTTTQLTTTPSKTTTMQTTTTTVSTTTTTMPPTTTLRTTSLSPTTLITHSETTLPLTTSSSSTTMTPIVTSSFTFQPTTTVQLKSCMELYSQTAQVDSGSVFAYKNKCYELIRHPARWVDAELHCRDLGGHLVNIEDKNEEKILYETMKAYYNLPIWIGLHDIHHEEQFQWTSGLPVVYTNWQADRLSGPNHWKEDCVAMEMEGINAGYWNDHECTELRGFVCQFVRNNRAASLIG